MKEVSNASKEDAIYVALQLQSWLLREHFKKTLPTITEQK
jgi:hypothetical protein